MGRRKNRQNQSSSTPVNTDSGESLEIDPVNVSQAPTKPSCQHAAKSVEPNHAKKNINLEDLGKLICSTCTKQGKLPAREEQVWFCLRCGSRSCSHQHSLDHHEVPHSDTHALAIKIPSFVAWCHICKCDVSEENNKKLKICISNLRQMYEKALNVISFETLPKIGTTKMEIGENIEPCTVVDNSSALKKKLCKSSRQPPTVRGLTNLGNTCFFNSVLQCLARTPNLIDVLKEMDDVPNRQVDIELKSGKRIEGELEGWDGLSQSLAGTLEQLRGGGPPLSPARLLGLLRKRCPQFQGYDQHDAHELLRHLLDAVRNQDLKRYRKLLLNEMGLNSKVNPSEVSEEKTKELKALDHEVTEKVTLVPEQVFRGFLVSTLECQECNTKSDCVESFLDLSLPVMTEKGMSMHHRKKAGVIAGTGGAIPVEEKGGAPISKHQLKKERKMARKNRGKKHGGGGNGNNQRKDETQSEQPPDQPPKEAVEVIAVSASEDKNKQESGYSSEKQGSGCGSSGRGTGSDSARASPSSIIEQMETLTIKPPPPGLFLCEGLPPTTDVPDFLQYRVSLGMKWTTEQDSVERDKYGVDKTETDRPNVSPLVLGGTGRLILSDGLDIVNMKLGEVTTQGTESVKDGATIMEEDPDWKTRIPSKWFRDAAQIKEEKKKAKRVGKLTVIEEEEAESEVSAIAEAENTLSNETPLPQLTEPSAPSSAAIEEVTSPPLLETCATPSVSFKEPSQEIGEDHETVSQPAHLEESISPTSSSKEIISSPPTPVEFSLVQVSRISEAILSRISYVLDHEEEEKCEESSEDNLNTGRLYEVPEEDEEDIQIEPLCGDFPFKTPSESESIGDGDTSRNKKRVQFTSIKPLFPRDEEEAIEEEASHAPPKIIEECSVECCLKQFTSVEEMSGSNKVGCTVCTTRENKEDKKTVYTKSTKQLLIKQVPPVLILHLKRFQLQMYSFRKLSRHVSFPLTLDLAPYCNSELSQEGREEPSKVPYTLYGVVEHSGTFNGGHYVAYVKVETENDCRWYCISDSHVNEVSENRVLNSQAYLLFYKQVPSS